MGTLFSTQKEKSPAFQKYINYQLVIGGEGHLSSDLYTFSHSTNTLAQCVLVCQTSCSGVEGGGKSRGTRFLPLNLVLSVKLESDFLVTDFDVCYL